MPRSSWTRSIVPNGDDNQTVYLVLDDFGDLGRAYCETYVERSGLEAVISDLLGGQYKNPVRVVGFNSRLIEAFRPLDYDDGNTAAISKPLWRSA